MERAFLSAVRSCVLRRRPGRARSSTAHAPPPPLARRTPTRQLLASIASDPSCLKRMTAAELCSCLGRLQADAYSELAYLPWLQLSNVNLAFVQLVKSAKLQQLMAPVIGHPGFSILERGVLQQLSSFSSAELLRTFVTLQRLGVDRASPLLSRAFVEVLGRVRASSSSLSPPSSSSSLSSPSSSSSQPSSSAPSPPLSLIELHDLCLLLKDYGPVPTVVPHLSAQLRHAIARLPATADPDTAAVLADLVLLVRKSLPTAVVRAVVRSFVDVIGRCHGDPVPSAEHVRAYARMALKMIVTEERWHDQSSEAGAAAAVASTAATDNDDSSLREALARCLPAIAARVGELDASDLATVAACLRRWSLCSGDVGRAIESRALALLSVAATREPSCADAIGLVDVLLGGGGGSAGGIQSSLASSQAPPQPPAVRRRVAQLLERKLPDADVLLTLRLAGTLSQPAVLLQLGAGPGQMLRAAVLADFDRLFGMPARLVSLLNFAAAADAVLPRDDAWTESLVERLLDLLDRTQYGASTFAVCEIGCYLLPVCTQRCGGGAGSDGERQQASLGRLAARLAPFVPQMRLTAAVRLKRALNKAACTPRLQSKPRQQRPLGRTSESMVADKLLRHLNELLFQHALHDLTGLAARGGFPLLHYVARHVLTKDFPWDMRLQQEKLATQLMGQCRELITRLPFGGLLQLVQLYRQVRYYDAPALAVIEGRLHAAAAVDRDAPAEEAAWRPLLLSALRLFSLVGHTPANVTEFMALCSRVLITGEGATRPSDVLTFAYDLSCIGCFPRELLLSVFNVRFLSQLEDELMRMPPDMHKGYSRQLMCLNRAIVLEASPDLGIPWFHGSYAADNYRTYDDRVHVGRRFFADVDSVLASVLGPDCYARDTTTPYFHRLDFELAIVKGRPVKASALGSLPADAKRIGIMLLSDSMCCTHSSKLTGSVESSLRQLTLVGYDVIKIYRSEWIPSFDAIAFKANSLRKRIFGTDQ